MPTSLCRPGLFIRCSSRRFGQLVAIGSVPSVGGDAPPDGDADDNFDLDLNPENAPISNWLNGNAIFIRCSSRRFGQLVAIGSVPSVGGDAPPDGDADDNFDLDLNPENAPISNWLNGNAKLPGHRESP